MAPPKDKQQLSRGDFLKRGAIAGVGFAVAGPGVARAAETGLLDLDQAPKRLKGILAAQEFNLASIPNQQAFEALATIGRNLKIRTVKLSYDFNGDKELAQIDQMGTIGVNAVETLILDTGLARQIARACVRNDIYLVGRGQAGQWLFPSEPGINYHYQAMILPPNGLGAQLICESMFRQLGGRGKFVHLTGPAGASTDVAKTTAVDRALRKFPNIQLIRQRANADRETARTVLDSILTREGEIDAINCFNDDEALGALATLKERGLAGDVLLAGADAIPEAVDAVIAGDMYATEANAPPFTSGYCMMRALDTANGFRPNPVEGLMQMDLILLDNPASARTYKRIIGRGSKAFDYPRMSRVLHPRDWDPQWPLKTFTPGLAWTTGQGVPKPSGYRIPANYERSVRSGAYKRIDALYLGQLKKFPFIEAARKSRTGKTVFEQVYKIKL